MSTYLQSYVALYLLLSVVSVGDFFAQNLLNITFIRTIRWMENNSYYLYFSGVERSIVQNKSINHLLVSINFR